MGMIRVTDRTKTHERTWIFWVQYPHVLLSGYVRGERGPGKRKYLTTASYDRHDSRNSTINLEQVPLPAFVEVEVKNHILHAIRIGTGNLGKLSPMTSDRIGWGTPPEGEVSTE